MSHVLAERIWVPNVWSRIPVLGFMLLDGPGQGAWGQEKAMTPDAMLLIPEDVGDLTACVLREHYLRKTRQKHPDGHTDQGGRWYPTYGERRGCCSSVRHPSRDYPWPLMHHCRTLGHVAQLWGTPEARVKAETRAAANRLAKKAAKGEATLEELWWLVVIGRKVTVKKSPYLPILSVENPVAYAALAAAL